LGVHLEKKGGGLIFASEGSGLTTQSRNKERNMNLIYNSEQYSVVEFGADDGREALRFGGYEIMDKSGKREIFIGGTLARSFREEVENLIATEPSVEEIDDFLGKYDALMRQPVTLH
jgi:hypothetical protein